MLRGGRPGWVATVVALIGALATATGAAAPDPATAAPATTRYVPVGPLRLADTREADCGCRRIGDRRLEIDVTAHRDVPDGATAVAVTITALPTAAASFVNAGRGDTSTVNTRTDAVVANSAIVPLDPDGTLPISMYRPGDVVVDLTGVFVPAESSRAGRFVALRPTRLADTRVAGAPLAPGGELTVALPAGVRADATALAVNVTSVGDTRPGFLSARPAGAPAPRRLTSFLNQNGTGQATAASVILPVSADGVTIYSYGGGHVIVDVVGWFTGASSADSSAGLYVPSGPARLHDTRTRQPRLAADGTIELANPFGSAAAALVTNLTVTQADWAGFVTAYPAGTRRPPTSSVNVNFHDQTVANFAITTVSTRGAAYYAMSGIDVIVDVAGYFTGAPVAATEPKPPNTERTPRLLVIGDSAMAALDDVYTDAKAALAGVDVFMDADNCRRLVYPSCRSDVTGRIPTTALDAIRAAPGTYDIVYVDAGHNDWNDPDFAWQYDVIVQAARAKGAKVVLWATYTEFTTIGRGATEAYRYNNAITRRLSQLPQYADVLTADWSHYSAPRPEWFWDGTHMYRGGAWGTADYLARWVAAIVHRPCPRPLTPGGVVLDPCPPPDVTGPPPDVLSLY